MTAYFQMGHDTENLIGENDLNEFKGIILSPVNRSPEELKANIPEFRGKGSYDIIFDPQLYVPTSERQNLLNQPYFPSDLETADMSSSKWWDNLIKSLCKYVKELKVNTVASPVTLPKIWNDDYYALCVENSNKLVNVLEKNEIQTLLTVMVDINQINQDVVLRIASIISKTNSMGYYIVLATDTHPRRELADANALANIMKLIKELRDTNKILIMSCCSSDMLLYNVAGATHCATGKFFNLRRFTESRFEETPGGGGQIPYWFEHSLLAFLRDADISRLNENNHGDLIKTLFSNNYWANVILEQFKQTPEKAWLALSWRHYLSWFGKTELVLSKGNAYKLVNEWLNVAEKNWLLLEDENILLEEPRNNGSWIRPWRQALGDFIKYTTK